MSNIDTILYNGNIVTVDDAFSIAEAVAIGNGKFIASGNTEEILTLREDATHQIDLKGKTVVPGFIDTHPHIITWGTRKVSYISLEGLYSIEAIKQRLALEVKKKNHGEWIVTSPIGDPPYYFNVPNILKEQRWPTRWDLDEVTHHNPVFITAPSSQEPNTALLNSYGLKLMDVTKHTLSEQKGVEILKDPGTGEPTGQLRGMQPIYQYSPFYWRLMELLPKPRFDEITQGIKEVIQERNAAGMTTTYEAHNTSPRDLLFIKELLDRGELTMRVYFGYDLDTRISLPEIENWMQHLTHATGRGFGNDRLTIGGITVSIDGPTHFGASLMNKPYNDAYGKPTEGMQIVATDKLKKITALAATYNLRMNSCVAGDKAVDITLEAFEEANKVVSIKDKRWVLQHIQFPSRENIKRIKDLGVVVTTCSNFEWGKGEEIYVNRLGGGEYCDRAIPFRDWLDAGVITAQTTDFGPYQPMFTIWNSLQRIDGLTGKSLMTPHKQISREEALKIYTINGAKILFWEDKIGSIETGKLADLVVLNNDILHCPLDEIRDTEVVMTMVGGEIVYQN